MANLTQKKDKSESITEIKVNFTTSNVIQFKNSQTTSESEKRKKAQKAISETVKNFYW